MKAALLAVFLVFSAPLWAHGNQEGSAECSDKVLLEEVPSTMSGVLEALRTEMRVILLEDKKIVASLRELRQLALGTRLHATEDLQYLYLFVRGLNIAERLKPILNAADRLHYHHNRRIQQLKTELPEPVDTRLGMLVAGFTSLFRKALPGLREIWPSQEFLNPFEICALSP